MEEKKDNKQAEAAKEVALGAKNEQEKLSYDELNQACADMSQQLQNQDAYIQKMYKQMQEMNFALQTKRMDYLFKVVELSMSDNAAYKFEADFVNDCMAEIQQSMTIPEEPENDKAN